MDRLPALTVGRERSERTRLLFGSGTAAALALLSLGACQRNKKPQAPVPRVNAVQADPSQANSAERFCEVRGTSESAKSFRYPDLAGPAPAVNGRQRWVNVWATWCKPCVEELPMLVRWQTQLTNAGSAFDLVLLSLDGDDDSIQRFRHDHPGTPPSLRIKDPALAEPWMATLGLEKASSIPIHVFVDTQGRVRCARTGSLDRDHLQAVQAVLTGS